MTWRICVIALLAVLAACVPATPPPHLGATPGAAVVVSDDRYQTDAFSVTYPAGWRAITSPAGEAPFVTFASPDNCAVIVLSLDERSAPEGAGCAADEWRETARVLEGEPVLYAALRAPAESWAEAQAAFEALIASLTRP